MEAPKRNLIVNYLPPDLTEGELYNMFAFCGMIKKAKIVRNSRTGESLGYGFVVYVSACDAMAAQMVMDGHKIRGKHLKVAFARPRGEDIMNSNLYVAYLPPAVDEGKLVELFGQCGEVIEVKILRDKITGQSRGVGFVRFALHSSALKARDTLNFYTFKGTNRPISVKFKKVKSKNEPGESTATTA